MTRALQWLTILGVVLIVGGIWRGFQNPEDGRSPHPVVHSDDERGSRSAIHPDAKATRDSWGRPATLSDHFARHGADFKARDAADYARQAHLFLERAKTAGLPAKRDADGSLRVFDPRTGAFGAYNADGTTKTYFKPGSRSYFDRQPGTPIDLRTAR